MGNEKHEAKKREILDSAFRIWGKCRYQETSLSELAAAHNMTKQAIYRYYSSKGKLEEAMEADAMAVYRKEVTGISKALEEADPDDFAAVYMNSSVQFMKKYHSRMAYLSFRYRRDDFGPPHIREYMDNLAKTARRRAGIPEVATRYLSTLGLVEAHSRTSGSWERAWEKGFASPALDRMPRFDTLVTDAMKVDYSAFGSDPLIRAVFETVMEEAGVGVSLGKVARKAGLTKSSLYNYWPGKEAMLSDVLGRQVKVFSDMFDEYSSRYDDPADKLFSYLAFTATFFRRTPEVLNYMQRVMSFGVDPPKNNRIAAGGFVQSFKEIMESGTLDFGEYDPFNFLGLVNLAAVNEIKYHLTEGSARIRIDQCLKDLYLLIAGGISALRRTTG